MNTFNSYSKLLLHLGRLLVRTAEHEEELPQAGAIRRELEAAVQDLKAIKELQEHHWLAWRQATKDLQQGMAAGRFVASRVRYLVRGQWGRSDPRLLEFDVMPLGRRRRGKSVPKVNGSEQAM